MRTMSPARAASQRVVGAGEGAEELLDDPVEAALRLAGRQLGHRGLRADDELDLRDQVDDDLAALAERLPEPLPPQADPLLALGEDLPHDLAEGLIDGGLGDVALVLVELAGDEDPALADDGPVQLVHER
jgi:hypothetical protein